MSSAADRPAPRLAAVVVTHDHAATIGVALEALLGELGSGDELIVVDNASQDGTAGRARGLLDRAAASGGPACSVIEAGANLGFAAGCNRGARAAAAELLVFLNPDAAVASGFGGAIRRPYVEGRGWTAWQGLVTSGGGRTVNSRGGVVHFTGIAWAGGAGEPLDGPLPEGEPGFVSGACLAIARADFERLGGFAEPFFLYHEDVDLSLRIRLAGGVLGIEPAARADHAYEFHRGASKWRYLERNRWATLIRVYPAPLLALLAPALASTELALIGVALAGGWGRQKLAAWSDTALALPRLLSERRTIQRTGAGSRRAASARLARGLVPGLGSAYLGRLARAPGLGAALRAYWAVVVALLGAARA